MMTHQSSLLPSANPSAIPTQWSTGMSVSRRSAGIPSEEPSSQMPTGMPTIYPSTHWPSGIQVLTSNIYFSSSTTTA